MIPHKIDYSERKYKTVALLTTDTTGGITIPNTYVVGVARFVANGIDPDCYVALYWDRGGSEETIIASTRGDVDIKFDMSSAAYQFTGNGTRKFLIVLKNDLMATSPVFGGLVEITRLA